MTRQTLLAVLAHPDDETFGMGGTLALYSRRNVACHLVCATRGEAGDVAPEFLEGYHSIGERREAELRCAAGILGLSGVYFLDYRDSGMPGSPDNQHPQALINVPQGELAARIATFIRHLRPQVVITFDPIGGYKHPDHIAIHHATVQAFKLASDPAFEDGQALHQADKLYYHVISMRFLKIGVRLLKLFGRDPRHFGRNGDIDLLALIEESDFPVHVRLNCRSAAKDKGAAYDCHASQLGSTPRRGPITWLTRWLDGTETYMRAYPPAGDDVRENDLFQ